MTDSVVMHPLIEAPLPDTPEDISRAIQAKRWKFATVIEGSSGPAGVPTDKEGALIYLKILADLDHSAQNERRLQNDTQVANSIDAMAVVNQIRSGIKTGSLYRTEEPVGTIPTPALTGTTDKPINEGEMELGTCHETHAQFHARMNKENT